LIGLRVKNLITPLFDNLSFDLPATGLYGIIGRNGIGKSTLFSMISGEIKTDGTCITSGKVSYVPSLAIFDQHPCRRPSPRASTSTTRIAVTAAWPSSPAHTAVQ